MNTLGNRMQYKDYYLYLIKISWPALIGLFIIFIFLSLRFFCYLQHYRAGKLEKNQYRHWLLGLRFIISITVLVIYQDMFVKNYPDWLSLPSVSYGVVYSLEVTNELADQYYIISINNGEESLSFKVDQNIFNEFKVNDAVKIEYLTVKKDVFRCTLY